MRTILCFVAAALFLCAAVGWPAIPNAQIWGFFCLALGFALEGYNIKFSK